MLDSSTKPTLAFIGAGRVGSTLSQTLRWRGYTITSVFSRSRESAQQLADKLNCAVAESAAAAALSASLTFLTVPDDAIHSVCEAIAANSELSGRAIVHTSGVSELDLLTPVKQHGAWVGGLHPMLAIMDREISPQIAFSIPWVVNKPDVTFGVEAEAEPLRTWLGGIVHALNGIALWLRPGQDRARYHAAGVIASNYLVTLFAEGLGLLETLQTDLDVDENVLRQTLLHLIEGTLQNIKSMGAERALTGPIVRGDAGTIRKHLVALDQFDPELAAMYRILGKRTARLAARRGISDEKLEAVLKNLG